MSATSCLRFLRPYLYQIVPITTKSAYLRFFNTTRCLEGKRGPRIKNLASVVHSLDDSVEFRGAVEERIKELEAAKALVYPRIRRDDAALSCSDFLARYSNLHPGELKSEETVLVRGIY
jgi:lysyl-tRNA synthetase class 2